MNPRHPNPRHSNRRRPRPPREDGAALLVALVLVLVGTLLGVSVTQSSRVEERLVFNEQYRERAFRVAEAATREAIEEADITVLAETPGDHAAIIASVDEAITVSAKVRLDGIGHAEGFSFGTFQNYLLSAGAEARIDGVDTVRGVRQGAARRGKVTPR